MEKLTIELVYESFDFCHSKYIVLCNGHQIGKATKGHGGTDVGYGWKAHIECEVGLVKAEDGTTQNAFCRKIKNELQEAFAAQEAERIDDELLSRAGI